MSNVFRCRVCHRLIRARLGQNPFDYPENNRIKLWQIPDLCDSRDSECRIRYYEMRDMREEIDRLREKISKLKKVVPDTQKNKRRIRGGVLTNLIELLK